MLKIENESYKIASQNNGLSLSNDEKAKKILAEIEARIARSNPNIGRVQSVILKNGPIAFKIATIYQILEAETGNHHHFSLTLQTWHFAKNGTLSEKPQHNITLDDNNGDEIGILRDSIGAFFEGVTEVPNKYAVINKNHYENLNKANNRSNNINDLLSDEESFNQIVKQGGISLFKSLTEWIVNSENPQIVVNKLKELNAETLKDINIITGLSQFHKVLEIWENESNNSQEEFWQSTFSQFSWVISQIFSNPVLLLTEKAYVGGKSFDNRGGNVVDFLCKNNITDNAVLIEIKTPKTKLLGSAYRHTYSASIELSGAINQLLNYKKHIQSEYAILTSNSKGDQNVVALNPKTVLIIGNVSQEFLGERTQIEAFELCRCNSKDVEIITFDELFQKIHLLISLFEEGVVKSEHK